MIKFVALLLININIAVAVLRNFRFRDANALLLGKSLPNFSEFALGDIQNIFPPPRMDDVLKVSNKIKKDGYPVETHHVVTQDGYILELHRIPSRSANRTNANKNQLPPVLLMHGILDSSSTWILMGPGRGLGYILSDLGYDVWMGNVRGNHYSRHHETLQPDGNMFHRRRFWEFSWHEIGMYDLPAMIDYVLQHTKSEKLQYIGHSQGTTAFFVMASERPEYNQKILLMQALAPIVFMKNVESPLCRLIAILLEKKQMLVNLIGLYEIFPGDNLVTSAAGLVCRKQAKYAELCENILFLISGYNSELFNKEELPLVMEYTPAGASTRQIIHYGQLMKNDYFRQFDHGLLKNLQIYRSKSPPEYRLHQVSAPVALHYGLNDLLAAVVDVKKLASRLPNVVKFHQVPYPRFTHMDFVWALNVSSILYDDVIDLMKKAENGDFLQKTNNKNENSK